MHGRFLTVGVLVATLILPSIHPARADSTVDDTLTWLQWWEMNRETFLAKTAGPNPAATQPSDDPVIQRATDALLEATQQPGRDLRAEAALSLARIESASKPKTNHHSATHPSATAPSEPDPIRDRLLALTQDPDDRVQARAWVSLGLINQEDELLKPPPTDDIQTLAIVTGLGLLDNPSNKALARLREVFDQSHVAEIQRMAMWALRVYHHDHPEEAIDEDRTRLLKLLRKTANPILACEALLSLAWVGDERDLPSLTAVAELSDAAQNLPVFRAVTSVKSNDDPLKIGMPDALRLRGAACLALAQMESHGSHAQRADGGVNPAANDIFNVLSRNVMKLENEEVARAHAIYIYSVPCSYYPGFSTLALAQRGDSTLLVNLLDMRWPGNRVGQLPVFPEQTHPFYKPEVVRDLPQRAYAALALGIYAGGGGRVMIDKVKNAPRIGQQALDTVSLLRMHAVHADEPAHFRAACALALGLAGAPADAITYVASQTSAASEPFVSGNIVLALALVKDPRALDGAVALLDKGSKDIDVAAILNSHFEQHIDFLTPSDTRAISQMQNTLGARAAITGLAVLGDPRAASILKQQWGTDQWLSLEAARALGACGDKDAVDSFIQLMQQDQKPHIAALAAQSLGEMLDRERPSRLSRLTIGNYPALPVQDSSADWLQLGKNKNVIEREFHGLGNRFLYFYLLPSRAAWN